MGLLGGIAFAGLILILGSPSKFQIDVLIAPSFAGITFFSVLIPRDEYFGTLILLLMAVSLFSLFGSVAAANIGSFGTTNNRWLRWFSEGSIILALAFFAVVLPLLIAPIDFAIIGAVMVVEVALLASLGGLLIHQRLQIRPKPTRSDT